jgi:hypothetical protein
MTNPIPADLLEQRAEEQRRRLHNTVVELRSSVRERLDVQRNAQQYVWRASAVAGILGLIAGYGAAGMFID